MKIKKLMMLLVMMNASLFSLSAVASIAIKYSGPVVQGQDACDRIVGHWKGEGHISAFAILSCSYLGSGDITRQGEPGHYNVHVDLNTTSYWPCIKNVNRNLSAVCHDGVVTIATNEVKIGGTTDGNVAKFTHGTITFSGITANIDWINLTKL
jgi:hypothetical protein